MAVTAREVIMIFRGQNYLSSAIRRVSADVAGLTRMQQLQVQRAVATGQVRRAQIQRAAMQQELASVQTAANRRLAIEKQLGRALTAEEAKNISSGARRAALERDLAGNLSATAGIRQRLTAN